MKMADSTDPPGVYKQVTGLSRGLAVLQCLTAHPQGRASAGDVARQTGIHRTTVRRLLETLQREGFVERNDNDGLFQLTIKIRQLGESFTDQEWVSSLAAPILRRLSEQVVWPCDLGIPNGTAMVIRDSTHHFSPLSFHRGMIGTRMPMLKTAMGRAYLAFSREKVRAAVLRLILDDPDPSVRMTGSPLPIEEIIRNTREQGFGMNYREWKPEEKTAAIALPILNKTEDVVACINIIVNTVGITVDRMKSDLLPELRLATNAIERLIENR
jgi:IclR family transcriptional regulator, mhp operon transcriptional activator